MTTIENMLNRLNLIIIIVSCILPCSVMQAMPRDTVPSDTMIVKGRLDNGLTYYIRHNSNPEGCADFYIVHNVGALQEEDSQNGLAHFLEHMAFNGTRHYPDKTILEFLAEEGVRFGYNVNAYTTRTETVYNLSSIPLVRNSFVDSVLMVLHDWSCDILCEEDALDAERGVINEEWRRKDSPRMRMMSLQNNLIYKGARHTERSVLGTLDVINGFARQDILDFYHKWYRPDLQAVIIVGDIDPADMEARVKRLFSDIPRRESPARKEACPVPALKEPLFENMTDPDIRYQTLKVMHKTPFPERKLRNTRWFIKDYYCRQIAVTAVGERFSRAARNPGSHVKSSVLVLLQSGTDFYTSMFTIMPESEAYLEDALTFYGLEMKRVREYGISRDEFENARFNVFKRRRLNVDRTPEEITDKELVQACIGEFLYGIPAVAPDERTRIEREILGSITYEDVLPYLSDMFEASEKIYSYSINESAAGILPSAERMKTLLDEAGAADVQPDFLTFDKMSLDVCVTPGTVAEKGRVAGTGIEKWTLGNGASLYWNHVPEVADNRHISLDIIFDSGYNSFPQDSLGTYLAAAYFIERYAGFRDADRMSVLGRPECSGASVSLSVEPGFSEVSMTADSSSLDKGFRMLHLYLAEPCFSSESTLAKYIRDNVSYRRGPLTPEDRFARAVKRLEYGDHPWLVSLDSTDFLDMRRQMLDDVFTRSFGDFGNMSVYITSDMDKDTVKALVGKYLASLGAGHSFREASLKPPYPFYRGEVKIDSSYAVRTVPKSTVEYEFRTRLPLTPEKVAALDVLDYIMSQRYMDQIREARGGTYHVAVGISASPAGKGKVSMSVSFETRPDIVDLLVEDVQKGMDAICKDGPGQEELENARKYLLKHETEQERTLRNSLVSMNARMEDFIRYGYDVHGGYREALEKMTARDVMTVARKLNGRDRLVAVYRENLEK